MAALGSKAITAHDDTREFIRGLEMTARKVLTNANKKRMQELQRQQSLARRLGANPEADTPKKFVIEVPPDAEDWGDQLASKTMEIAPTGMVVAVRGTRRSSRRNQIDNIEPAGASLPQLGEGGRLATGGGDAGSKAGVLGRKLPRISRRAGGLTLSTPATGQARGDGAEVAPAASSKRIARAGVPAAKIDGRLTVSPLFSASMMELTKPIKHTNQDEDPLSGGVGGGEDEEEAVGIANMRVVNASKIIGKGRSVGKGSYASRKPRGRGAAEAEGQGVTSWSSDDLRVKYRAEREREEAYQAFRLEEQVAEALDQDYGQVVAVPEVDRHPLYVAYYNQLEQENTRCLLRASARNKMKRFITDVHTVWLTNLSHHPEFRRMVRGAAMHQEGGNGGSDDIQNHPETAARRGLDDGRDSAAIAASHSQIQSVQPGRAFRGAFFYSSGSKDSPSSTRQPTNDSISQGDSQRRVRPVAASGATAPVQVHNSLSHGGSDDDVGGKPPVLPPPPLPAPAMAVLVAERHRFAPVSTASAGGTVRRRSLGGSAAKRRSIGGGGGAGGDSGSWSDMATRVLRIVRFAPPRPPPPLPQHVLPASGIEARNTNNDDTSGEPTAATEILPATAGKEEGDEGGTPSGVGVVVQHDQRRPSAVPPPEATWMISSFHPFDGSETRVTIGDAAVLKVVGEALSASTPLATAGLLGADTALASSKGELTRAGAGGASSSPVSGPVTQGGLADGRERVLILRQGVRIPILREDGSLAGRVLSVVEVFASSCSSRPFGRPGTSTGVDYAGGGGGGGGGGGEEDAEKLAAIAADNVVLEVAAYPVGSFLTPETGEPEHSNGQQLRREGRRRVVTTADSLWQRRRQMHPDVHLLEKPPPGLAGWLERRTVVPSASEARDTDGESGNAAEEVTGSEGRGQEVEGSTRDGSEVGDSGETRINERVQAAALRDLLNMVAFGPAGDGQGRHEGSFSTAMPLLLRPAQSFGPEGPIAPSAAEAITSTPSSTSAASGLSTAAAVAAAVVERGGVPTLLAQESRAEVLLSLVRLGDSGRGRVPAISVDGVDGSCVTLDDSEKSLAQAWEEEADRVEPLSMRVSGRRAYNREVPGTCNIGRMGVTFDYPQAPERTRAVASFFRDASVSSSDSVMVVVALALDTPRLGPHLTAWERGPFEPEAAPDEDVLDIVPRVMIPPGTVLREGVVSELGGKVASDALILTSAEKEVDYDLPDPLAVGGGEGGAAAAAEARLQEMARREWVRHRRDWRERDEKGFRRLAVYRLLEPDGYMQTLGFGVTKRAALANTAAVCGRSTFHSEQRCTEQLCRQRTAKDYAYVSANDEHRGPSDPGSYSVSCKYERMIALMRTGLERYNAEMARVAVERERQAKDAALQAKVEIGKAQLANRRAREDAAARSLVRKTDAQHLKISAGADRSRQKWELRMQDSHVLETRGSWEKRKDMGGSVFYSCTSEEGLPEPYSWDPPECWDALDPSVLALAEAAAADESLAESIGEGSGTGVDGQEGGTRAGGPLTEDLSSLRLLGVDPDRPGGDNVVAAGGDGIDEGASAEPRRLSDDQRLSLAVDRLAGNEKLLGALAWRLGIPLADVRPDGREPPLARDRGEDEEELDENREQIELGEHDDASDSEGERGDERGPPGPLPQDHSDLRRIRVAERKRAAQVAKGHGHTQPKRQSIVPRLPLSGGVQDEDAAGLEGQVGGLGWRRLARENLGQKFLERVVNPRMQGPWAEAVNTRPKPRPTSTTDPSKATKRSEDWAIPVDTMFVPDVLEEHARVLQEAERRMKKEELLDDSSSGPFDAAKFAANGPQEFTSVERRMMALAETDGRSKEEIEEEENKAKAVIAAKAGNLADLEALLYENVPPDTKDSNGNSLLLVAAQQGNKRIIKFLLRKGATMNMQNLDGNTVLHFCYSQGRQDLADYLKGKGADDSLLNSEGLTCYEGLQADRVANI